MTVTASTTRNDYTAGSAQNVYSYTFQLNEATDVDVYLDGVLQTLNTHYTVQNVGNSTGGTITFTLVDADNNPIYPTEGAVINILMAMDLDRDTAYQPSGAFLAADVNNDFDRLWLASNQQQTEINRTLRLQDTDITTANMELPQNSTRRNKLLGFNNDGNPVAVTNNQSNWDVAYDNMIVSTSFTDGNYTLTQQDGGTFTNNFDGRYFQNTGGNIYGGIDVNGAITSTGNLNITGTITASGYNNTNWDSAYNKKITSVDYSVGTNTLTLEQQDGNSLTTTLTGISDIALSYNGVVKAEAVATGIDVTGNVSLDDNGKALFGDGNDLEIYHDGSNSYIHDTGTGGLYIRGSDEIALRSSSNENIFLGLTDGSAYVYHDGNVKLQTTSTGIDVTGTVTADGLTVSNVTNSVLKLESTGTGLGSGAVIGDIQFYGNDASVPAAGIKAGIKVETVAALGDDAQMKFTTSDGATNNIDRMLIANNGDISFYEDTGTTPKLFWDASAERLGIGTTSPSQTLDVAGNIQATGTRSIAALYDSNHYMRLEGNSSGGILKGTDGGVVTTLVRSYGDSYFNGGNLGIGTSSPTYPLDIAGASGTTLSVRNTSTVSSILLSNGSSANQIFSRGANSSTGRDLAFVQGTSEAMRIDSSGNLLVGKTISNSAIDGIELRASNEINATKTNGVPLYLRRDGNDGEFVGFNKDGSVVGSIGTVTNRLHIGSGNTFITFYDDGDAIYPAQSNGTLRDNAIDIGTSSGRYKDIYLSGGIKGTNLTFSGNNSTEHARIDPSGNVGIGTTSPDQKLEVDGAVKVTNFFTGETSTNSGYFDFVPSTSTARITTKGNDGSTLGKFQILQQASDGSPNATPFHIDTNSNVGIGTDSPTSNLHVLSSGDTIARITSADGNGAFLDLGDASDPDGGRIVYDSGSNLALYTVSTERMRIDSSGNVGIGTTSPDSLLEVVGADPILTVRDTETGLASTNATLRLAESGGGDALGNYWDINYTSNSALRILSNTTERMRIDSSGNVGIGTTSPSASGSRQTLHINSDTNGSALRLSQGSNSSLIRYDDSDGLQIGTIANKDLRLETNDTERVRIDTSGRVGIGTSNPNSALHVITSSNFLQNFLKLESSSGTRARIGSNLQDNAYLELYDGSGNLKTNFRTDGNKSFIAGGGNFGIGTTNPATELDVDGTITADNVKLDNTNIQPSYNHHTQLFAGYTNLTTTPSKIGNDFYLRNYSSNYYKRFIEVNATLSYVGITSTNDFNLRVILVVPSSSGNAVDIGSIESITSTSTYNRDIVMSGDLTHWFSDYVGIGANSDGTSPFPVIVSAVYNPTTDKTTFNVGVYGASIPSVGDSLYVHPFDWESTGSELIGHTKQFDVYSETAMAYQTYAKVYFGNIDRTASCRIKMYETHSSDSVAVTKLEVFQLDQKG